ETLIKNDIISYVDNSGRAIIYGSSKQDNLGDGELTNLVLQKSILLSIANLPSSLNLNEQLIDLINLAKSLLTQKVFLLFLVMVMIQLLEQNILMPYMVGAMMIR
ncbi:hypothetical protein L5U12_003594, partial [Acinetobacter baumannii]